MVETPRLVSEGGTLAETGQPALVSLLRELREIVAGQEAEREFVDRLLAPYEVGEHCRRGTPIEGCLVDP